MEVDLNAGGRRGQNEDQESECDCECESEDECRAREDVQQVSEEDGYNEQALRLSCVIIMQIRIQHSL